MGEPQPRVAVVDEHDRFIRWEDRRIVHRDRLVHRTIHVLLFTTDGRFVIQRRQDDKLTFPGHWDLSCSGHVEEPDYPAGPDDRLDIVYAGCAARARVIASLTSSSVLIATGDSASPLIGETR